MRPYINDPEGHIPHGPKLGQSFLEIAESTASDFYQPPNHAQVQLAEQLPEIAQSPQPFNIKLDDYQAWCELNWVKPHGSLESMERINAKLLEELEEVQKGITIPSELISELGDLLWCVQSTASNLKINVKHALMRLFDRYGRGTRYFDNGNLPPWVKLAQELTYNDQLSIQDIEELVELGFEPQASPIMYIDKPDDLPKYEQINDAVLAIAINTRLLESIAADNYSADVYQSGQPMQAATAENLAGQIYLNVAYLAKYAASSSLSEVVRYNILKLSERVSSKTVDKSEGKR